MPAPLSVPQAGASSTRHIAGALPGKPLSAGLCGRPIASYRQREQCCSRWAPHSSRVATGTPFLDPESSPDAALPSEPATAGTATPHNVQGEDKAFACLMNVAYFQSPSSNVLGILAVRSLTFPDPPSGTRTRNSCSASNDPDCALTNATRRQWVISRWLTL